MLIGFWLLFLYTFCFETVKWDKLYFSLIGKNNMNICHYSCISMQKSNLKNLHILNVHISTHEILANLRKV